MFQQPEQRRSCQLYSSNGVDTQNAEQADSADHEYPGVNNLGRRFVQRQQSQIIYLRREYKDGNHIDKSDGNDAYQQ